jgi:hypothetical protein
MRLIALAAATEAVDAVDQVETSAEDAAPRPGEPLPMPTEPGSEATTAVLGKGGFRQRALMLMIAALGSLMLITACTSDAETGTGDEGDGTEESAPPAGDGDESADEAAPEPPAGGGENTDGVEDGLSNEDWLVIIVLGLGAAAVLFGATSMASNRSRKKEAARASLNRDLDRVVGGTRWVHDQGSIDVLSTSNPEQLRSVWTTVRDRIVNLEGEAATLAAGVPNSNLERSLSYLTECLAGLRGALESNVSVRLDSGAGRDDLVAASNQAAYDRRPQLMAAIEPIAAARR